MKFRKIIAIILAVWLPLLSGNALAVAVSMQSTCQEHAMHAASVAAQHHHAGGMSCNDCGFCRLAGTAYPAIRYAMPSSIAQAGPARSFYLLSFSSIASPPLVPPPLAAL